LKPLPRVEEREVEYKSRLSRETPPKMEFSASKGKPEAIKLTFKKFQKKKRGHSP